MSRIISDAGYYPPGVSSAHPHFYDVVDERCEECGAYMAEVDGPTSDGCCPRCGYLVDREQRAEDARIDAEEGR